MAYSDDTEPSFAQHFGDWDSIPQPPVDALGRWRVVDAEGRPMSDAYEKLARPVLAVITEETLARKEMEARLRAAARERAQAGWGLDASYVDKAPAERPAGAPDSFAQRFGEWERLPQQGDDTFYRPRVADAAGRPMSDFYEAFARPAGTPDLFAQRFGEWERLPQQGADSLYRPRVTDAEGRPMSDAFEAFARPGPTGAMEAAERARKAAAERAQAGWDIDGTDVVKSGVTGLAKGAIGVVGGGGDAWSLIDSGLAKAGLSEGQRSLVRNVLAATPLGFPLRGPTSKDIQGKVEEYTGPFYKPKTRLGRYTQTATEFAPGAALPGGVLRNLVKFALLPGIASEAAGEATEGTKWEPYARVGAALATGLGAAALTRPRMRSAQRDDAPDASSTAPEGGPTAQSNVPNARARANKWGIYDPPNLPDRPFSADYPRGAQADAKGRLLYDMDGRPMPVPDPITGEPMIVGRAILGGADQALTPAQAERLVEILTGKPTSMLSPRQIDVDTAGQFWKYPSPAGGYDKWLEMRKGMTPRITERVKRHEVGHGTDDAVGGDVVSLGGIPYNTVQSGPPSKIIGDQLALIFHDLNTNPSRNTRPGLGRNSPPGIGRNSPPGIGHSSTPGIGHNSKMTSPQDFGYLTDVDIRGELWAEAFRAYFTNPNYIKSVAPDVAAFLRQKVNEHPWLSNFLRFNAIPPVAVGATLDAITREESELEPASTAAPGIKQKAHSRRSNDAL